MARLPYVDPEKAAPEVREALQALPVPLKIFRMMAHAESSFRPLLRLGASILGGQLLDGKLRELAILQAAQLTPGSYEWIQHVPIALAAGASQEQIDALERGDYEADCFDPDERLVLHFGADTLQGARVSDQRFAAMRERFSAREIVELILALGYYSMLSRLTEVTATDHDAPSGTKVVDALEDAG